jgi:ParB family chromosome partitioning protein
MCAKRNALGKGLTALLSDSQPATPGEGTVPVNTVSEIPLDQIEANPFQPREHITEENLEGLVKSIQIHGIIQPLTIRRVEQDQYQIISGERRAWAASRAGLERVPAFVRLADDQNMLEMALIENTHRENLNAVEIALSYKRLIEECRLNQDSLAERIGRDRTTVTNYLRLLKLPDEVQIALTEERISMGHARAIININDADTQLKVFRTIQDRSLSVRQTEDLVKTLKTPEDPEPDDSPDREGAYDKWEKEFARLYDTPVKIKTKKNGKGEVVIPFQSEEELKRISEMIRTGTGEDDTASSTRS